MHKKIYILVLMIICIFCVNKVYAYEAYKVGDKVTYNGEDYYVIEDSGADKYYVTLLKEKPLTSEEVNKYGRDENNELFINKYADMHQSSDKAAVAYYTSKACGMIKIDENGNELVVSECYASYDLSDVKKVVDNWSSNNFTQDDLIEIDGYKARLLTLDELLENFSYEAHGIYCGLPVYGPSSATPTWLYDNDYGFWLMDDYEDRNDVKNLLSKNGVNRGAVYDPRGVIRPVINLAKCSIGDCTNCKNGYTYDKQKVKKYNEFKIGDEITYQGEKYYVIKNSTSSSKTLTLLKAEPLTTDEINKNKGDLDFTSENNGMPYYKSRDCYYNSENDHNTIGCTNSYNRSYVKQVIDKWSESFDDLIEVGGYKARLLNEYDLYRLGYYKQLVITSYGFCKTEDTPEWVFDNIYWTMFSVEDGSSIYEVTEKECLDVESDDPAYQKFYKKSLNTYESSAVRPVINIDKCAVDGGCYEEEVEVEVAVGCKDTNDNTNDNVVNVPSTLKNISNVILIICGILILSGVGIIIFNYMKARKERK